MQSLTGFLPDTIQEVGRLFSFWTGSVAKMSILGGLSMPAYSRRPDFLSLAAVEMFVSLGARDLTTEKSSRVSQSVHGEM